MFGFFKTLRLSLKNELLRRKRYYNDFKDTCKTCKYYKIEYGSYGDSCRIKHPDFNDSFNCDTSCEHYIIDFKYKKVS